LKIVAIIPTLNEVNNIEKLFNKLNKLKIEIVILFIDDNSTDGTKEVIIKLNRKYKNIKYIFRPKRLGIGSAHKCGFKWAKKNHFKFCVTLDADMTHDPLLIKKMSSLLIKKEFEIISTSRFKLKNSLKSWPMIRVFITKLRYYLVCFLLNTNYDSSGGFRLYDLRKIKFKHLLMSRNNSYFFLIESLFFLEKLNYKIFEIPIILPYRLYGSSKMKLTDIFSSLLNLIKLRISNS